MLGCAALVGAIIAFPAGMMLGGSWARPEQAAERAAGEVPRARPHTGVRDFYSPSVLDDPYVIEQQLRVVEALELSCRQYGERCAEAQKARQRVKENGAR
jgi:hypothetical protein